MYIPTCIRALVNFLFPAFEQTGQSEVPSARQTSASLEDTTSLGGGTLSFVAGLSRPSFFFWHSADLSTTG